MSSLANRTILVVGANGVLGSHLVTALIGSGAVVWGTARSEDTRATLPAGLSGQLLCDLDDAASIDAFLATVTGTLPHLDGVIIGAGVVAFGTMRDTPAAIVDRLMRVNATGPVRVITGLMDLMQKGTEPFVLTLSGKIVETPMAGLSAYSASKTALYVYSLTAGREVRRDGVRWLDARPGHTETGLADRAVFGTAPNFGAGLQPGTVAARLVRGILDNEKDLPSSAFEA